MSSLPPVSVTPLNGLPLHLLSMTGVEELGRPFSYQVRVLVPAAAGDMPLDEALGQNLTVSLQVADGGTRCFNGYVTSIAFGGTERDHAVYDLTLHPWLWFLSRSADCRVLGGGSVPDVVKRVFRQHALARFDETLGAYPEREQVVQYRESDYQLVSRLLEDQGIYYFFRHQLGSHTLVLADALAAHGRVGGDGTVLFAPPTAAGGPDVDHLDDWRVAQEVQTAAYVTCDYDFSKPRADMLAQARPSSPRRGGGVVGEVFDSPGGYTVRAEGEALASLRAEELQQGCEVVAASGNTRALAVGDLFTLRGHPRRDQNREYLVVKAEYELRAPEAASGGVDATEPIFRGAYTLRDAGRRFRPARVTRRPTVQGPQTATVVGEKRADPDGGGAEIWTDPHGRVRLRFHWERFGSRRPPEREDPGRGDDARTCWVRVSQAWAGAGWGAVHIPRVGQEVIVDFLEGDPDRPIVTGRVYNGDNPPPYTLPDRKTQSGFRSRSTPDGGPDDGNELRFEDKKGSEELFIQAQRDLVTCVKRDARLTIAADRAKTVGGNETIEVAGIRSSTIKGEERQLFDDARRTRVAQADDLEIAGKLTAAFRGGREQTVGGGDRLTVDASDKTTVVHGRYDITADTAFRVAQGGSSLLVRDAVEVDAEGRIHLHNQRCEILLADGVVRITAADSITLACGAASLTLRQDGTIDLTGAQRVGVAGGGAVMELAAAGATLSGNKATVAATTLAELTGAIVKIN